MTIDIGASLRPNAAVSNNTTRVLIAGWIAFFIAFWVLATLAPHPFIPLLPAPGEVVHAMAPKYALYDALKNLMTSLFISLEAVAYATVIGLGLCYLATIPMFRIPITWIGQLRFLSLIGVTVVFLLITPNGHALKVSVLAFTIVVFFINDMLQVIDDIDMGRFDHARTLGLSQWMVLREVVIRGTLGQAFESLRMNAAMAWMMLTMVEGLSRSEGGVGVLLLSLQRAGNYPAILAIQMMIFLVGIGQDGLIKVIKAIACPYTVRK